MATEPTSEALSRPASPRLLWTVMVFMLAAATILWGASALVWVEQSYSMPLSGPRTSHVTGAMARPELGPLALATLAAIAAVLATGGWFRRIMGLLIVLEGGVLIWRIAQWQWATTPSGLGVPAGGKPGEVVSTGIVGPLLMFAAALVVVGVGGLVVAQAHRMPVMGAKYSAPATARTKPRDPDKRLWEALDAGEDPTDDGRR